MSHPSANSRSQSVLEMVFRHKWKVIFIPLLSFAMAATVILFFPRKYHSEAILFLQLGRESVGIDPTATAGQTIALQQSGRDEEVKSAVGVLQSRGVLDKTVERLSPEVVLGESGSFATEPNWMRNALGATVGRAIGWIKSVDPVSKREEALIELQQSLGVGTERGSTAIQVDVEADSPQLAQAILAQLIDVYREEYARVHRNQHSQDFFLEQREKLRSELDEAQLAVRQAKDEMGLASVDGRRSTLESQVSSIEGEKYDTEQQLATSLARADQLRGQLAKLPERVDTSRTVKPNEGADLLRQELYTLQIRKADLESRYSSEHPLVIAVSNQLDEARKVVDGQTSDRQETTDDVNPIHRELSLLLKQEETAVAGFDSRLDTLNEQLQLVHQDLKVLNSNELKLDELQREVRICEGKFFKYAENMEQARIDQELEKQRISNISISQEPLMFEKPVSPSKALVLLASIFLATAGTAAAVVASERLNDRIRDEDQLTQLLQVPVVAVIPDSQRPAEALRA